MVLVADHWPHCNDLADTLTQTCSKERPHRCLPNAPPHDAWSAIWTTGGAAEIRAADHLLGIPAAVPARYGAASSVQSAGADACWTPTADADAAACAPAAASTTSRRTPRQCGTPGSRPGALVGDVNAQPIKRSLQVASALLRTLWPSNLSLSEPYLRLPPVEP